MKKLGVIKLWNSVHVNSLQSQGQVIGRGVLKKARGKANCTYDKLNDSPAECSKVAVSSPLEFEYIT